MVGKGTSMANQEHLDVIKQGVVVWNEWREKHPEIQPDFDEANLEGAHLEHAHLSGANLRRAYLFKAQLVGTDFSDANLQGADLQSGWVEREVVAAREKEDREQRSVLFPVRLDDMVMQTPKAWATDVRRRWPIGDFTRWKDHDAYQQAFERLLRDLKKAHEREGQEMKE